MYFQMHGTKPSRKRRLGALVVNIGSNHARLYTLEEKNFWGLSLPTRALLHAPAF
jgi:hypothetical protein